MHCVFNILFKNRFKQSFDVFPGLVSFLARAKTYEARDWTRCHVNFILDQSKICKEMFSEI